jgi:prephenate dehydrogenase
VRIGVVGLGLIGGSVVLAALEAGFTVAFYEPLAEVDPTRFQRAQRVGSLLELTRQADLIFIATPISAISDVAAECGRTIRPGTIVSDLASVKLPVAQLLEPKLRGRAIYVPTHPMAGSERSGSQHANPALFRNSVTVVSPDYVSSLAELSDVEEFWTLVGSRPIRATVEEHDHLVGHISHFPHLLAAMLIETIHQSAPQALRLAGPALHDMTRIAASSPDLWTEILLANRLAVLSALRSFTSRISQISGLLESADSNQLQAFLEAAKQTREMVLR